MKKDIPTSPDAIRKRAKTERICFWVFLVLGILTIGTLPPFGVLFLVLAFLYSRGRKADLKLLSSQEQAKNTPGVPDSRPTSSSSAADYVTLDDITPDKYDVYKTIHTKVVGVTFKNEDGSSRQEIVSNCFPGMPLELEPFEYKGAPAFAVFNEFGEQLGNIPAHTAELIDSQPDGLLIGAEVIEVTGDDDTHFGCNILVTLYRRK